MRELLRHSRKHLEVVERVLPTLRIPRAQAGSDELLHERCLPSGCREERSQVTPVDAEARKPGARSRDIGLALAVQAPTGLVARHDEPVLLELPCEVERHRGAIAQLGLVDLVLVIGDSDCATPRPLRRRAWPCELLADDAKWQELVALEAQDRRQALDVVGSEEPIATTRSLRRDEALVLEVADLRDRDVGKLLAKLLADRADRAEARFRLALLTSCRNSAHRLRNVSRYLPICTSSSSSRTVDSMRLRFTYVPLRLPRSRMENVSPSRRSSAWRRDTVTSSRKTSHSGDRPINVLPSPGWNDCPAMPPPERTTSAGPVMPSAARRSISSPSSSMSKLIVVSEPISVVRSAPQREQ